MARKNDLAKLAALAGLGMVITEQYRNKVDLTEKKDSKVPTNFGDLVNPYPAKEEPRRKITDYISKAPSDDSRTDAASSGDEMSKYAASYKPKVNKPEAKALEVNNQPPLVITKKLENLPNDESAKSLKERNPPIVIPEPMKNLANDQSGKTVKERNPPIVIPNSMKNLPNYPTNFGKLVNPFPVDNKAITKAATRQAAIEATKKHAEAQKAVMAERLRNQKAQQDLGYGQPLKRGGAVKKMASGGMTSSASRRGDGIATKGKTRGKIC